MDLIRIFPFLLLITIGLTIHLLRFVEEGKQIAFRPTVIFRYLQISPHTNFMLDSQRIFDCLFSIPKNYLTKDYR